MEASQKHICSLVMNKCHDCKRTKVMKDVADKERTTTPRVKPVGATFKRLLRKIIKY